MGFRLQNIKLLHSRLNVNIFILSYRGYGESEGEPEEKGMGLDAEVRECRHAASFDVVARAYLQAAWSHIRKRSDVDPENLILFGRSMGGAVALSLAVKCALHSKPTRVLIACFFRARAPLCSHQSEIRGIVLENTFTCIADMADQMFPFLKPIKRWCARNACGQTARSHC